MILRQHVKYHTVKDFLGLKIKLKMKKNEWWDETQPYFEGKTLEEENESLEQILESKPKIIIFEKISNWWWYNIKYPIKQFLIGVRNIIHFFNVIWNNREYDNNSLYFLLKIKLQSTIKEHSKRKFYVGWEYEVEKMKLCIKLIDRVTDEYYENEYINYISNKYGDAKWEFISVEDTKNCKECKQLNFRYPKIEDGTYTKQEMDEESAKLIHQSHNKHNKARTLLFKILNRHSEKWWI